MPSIDLGKVVGPKGDIGETGAIGPAAGFGTPIVEVVEDLVDGEYISYPNVLVHASGPDTAKVFKFTFENIRGEKGDKGDKGDTGPAGPAGSTPNLSAYAPKASPVFSGSISLGRKSGTEVGDNSFAVGYDVTASAQQAHAEGWLTTASGNHSHAEGMKTKATAEGAHSEGSTTTASGAHSHAEGCDTTASGLNAHAEGWGSEAAGGYSHAEGFYTKAAAAYQHAGGIYNVESSNKSDKVIIGKGTESAHANCFRVTDTGVYATGAHNTTGADYAEMFEWADGNPNCEDRAGLFVTLDGDKIRIAGPQDDYILGIVSGDPSVVGDVQDDQWQGMFLYDVFGRPIWEDVETSDVTDAEGNIITPAHTEHRQKLNPDYDNSQRYQPRSQRPEWDAVGLLGKLVAVDDGSCQVNGWATVGQEGVATFSAQRTSYRVMSRIDNTHIRVLLK